MNYIDVAMLTDRTLTENDLGHGAGQFYGAHVMTSDSKGNLFIGETYEGKRVQKFTYRGSGPAQKPLIQ